MYRVDKMVDGKRVRMGRFESIEVASEVIDLDTQLNGAGNVYYIDREGNDESE